jgi:hypothetical protein
LVSNLRADLSLLLELLDLVQVDLQEGSVNNLRVDSSRPPELLDSVQDLLERLLQISNL